MPRGKRIPEPGLLPAVAGAAAAVAMLGLLMADPFGLVTLARERSFDALYAAFPRPPGSAKVVVVDIDDATLAGLGSWPLPRSQLVRLIDRMSAARPAAIAFDIFFPAADRYSARTLATELSRLPGGAAVQPLIAGMPDSDADFAAALQRSPSVIGALVAADRNVPTLNLIKVDGTLDRASTTRIEGIFGPYPPLAEAALGIGIESLWGEDGGTVRRVPLILSAGATNAPGLALEATRLAVAAPALEVDGTNAAVTFGAHAMRLGEGGAMRIHWSDPSGWRRRTVSALDVLDGRIAADRFAGAVVLVGSSAPEAGALRPTAAAALTPSVQIEAEAVEQLFAGAAPLRPPWLAGLDIGAALGLGLAAAWLATLRGPLFAGVSLLGLVGVWLVAAIAALRLSELLLDPLWPAAAAVVSGNIAAGTAFARTQRLKTLIARRFEQYLAPDVVRAIVARPDRLKRDGEIREVTALFTDIEGFTSLTSEVGPKRLIALLDPYFDGVCRIVTEHGGMIDLIVGDAVHAFFNMPLDLPDHADAALDCALAIARFADGFRRIPEAAEAGFGRTRIGIETGPAIVGDVGGPQRFNYTAHGRVANAAARLEAANKTLGTTICVGPGTAAKARRIRLRQVGTAELRGFPAPVDVYTPDEAGLSPPISRPSEPGPAPRS